MFPSYLHRHSGVGVQAPQTRPEDHASGLVGDGQRTSYSEPDRSRSYRHRRESRGSSQPPRPAGRAMRGARRRIAYDACDGGEAPPMELRNSLFAHRLPMRGQSKTYTGCGGHVGGDDAMLCYVIPPTVRA